MEDVQFLLFRLTNNGIKLRHFPSLSGKNPWWFSSDRQVPRKRRPSGRAGTGPSGIAGLPKQAKRTGLPWLNESVVRFLFLGSYWMSGRNSKTKLSREGRKTMRIKKIKVVLLVIVAAALTVLVLHDETVQSNALVPGSRCTDVVRTVME